MSYSYDSEGFDIWIIGVNVFILLWGSVVGSGCWGVVGNIMWVSDDVCLCLLYDLVGLG